MVGSNALLSCVWPAVTWRAKMEPCLSQTRWTLVVKPPRERPNAWSSGSRSCARLRPPSSRELLPFFPPSGRSPAGPDDGAVDAPQVVIDLALVVQFVQQRGGDPGPSAIPAPPIEPGKDGLPGPVALGEIAPGRAGVQDPKDTVDDRAVVARRPPHLTEAGPLAEQGRDAVPLLVRQFVAAHDWLPEIDR